MANSYQDVLRINLQKLIDQSGANFTADDVINEFKSTKDPNSNRKLLTILKTITKHQPSARGLLPDIYRLLETKNPYYCLIHFLNVYSKSQSAHSIQAGSTLTAGHIDNGSSNKNSAEMITPSTPLPKVLDIVTPENVSEIKERVVQAATGGLSKSAKSTSVIGSGSGIVSGSNIPTTPTPTSSPSIIASGTGTNSNLLPIVFQKHQTINSNSSNISNILRSKNSFWDLSKMDLITFKNITINNIAAIPLTSQENIILYDLIYCLSGMRGNYIYPENNDCTNLNNNNSSNSRMSNNYNFDGNNMVKFKISDQIHCSLKDILNEILPLASYYVIIQKFIQKSSISSCGQVLQALSASLRSLIHDYYLLLAQLESELLSGDLTLYKLLFYIRPTLHIMEILAETVLDIQNSDLRGGQILTLLFDKINTLTGDDESQKFLIQLIKLSAIPYMNILQLWIEKGVINDPQQEFLVEDNEVIRREELPEYYSADYWEKRYTVRRERIPNFLEKLSDIILRTGKYLNVIRQCGKNVQSPQTLKKIQFSPVNQNYMTIIQNSYYFASKNLLEVLIKENDLMGHLQSVKRYLLLYQGDFISQFMDACEDELSKNVDKVLPMKIENLLGLILRLSSAKHDPYKDDLHCEFLTYDLATQMLKIINNEEEYWQVHDRIDLYGLECFAFKYDVKWPISLVLNHIAISKYQMLFRQLLYCKHVERQLCKVWKENNTAKKFSPQSAELYRSAFTLRQRMMNAIQNLEYYMMIEVIEPNWHIFIENMKKVENVDDVLVVHQDFLDLCLKNCMLTDPILLRSIIKLNNICLNFCEFIQKAQRYFSDAELSSMLCESDDDNSESDMDLSSHKQSESSLAPTETFSERVKRFDLEFTGLLIGFLKQINDVALNNPSDRFINLVYRINFNSFYNDQMDKLCAKDSMVPSHHR